MHDLIQMFTHGTNKTLELTTLPDHRKGHILVNYDGCLSLKMLYDDVKNTKENRNS